MNRTVQELIIEGVQQCKEDHFEKGIALFDQALSQQSDNEEALYNRAKAHFRLKNFELSINDFDALIERSPKNAFYFSERGVAHHLGGDSQKALKDLDKAAELEPMKPFRYSSRAFIKDRMGDLEGAIADYERAIELDPEDAISYNNKGLVEEKMGYRDRSKKSFEKADELDPKKAQMEVNTSSDKPEVDTKKMSLGQTASIAKHQPADITVNSPEENTADAISRTLDIKSYIKQVKAIISDKEERGAFNEFVKQFFSRKR